MLGPFEIKWHC